MYKLKFIFYIFSTVTTCVLTAVAVFTTLLYPVDTLKSTVLWQILLVSGLCALGSLIIWGREMNPRRGEIVVRTVGHYIYCNVIVLGAGSLFDWYNASNPKSLITMIISVAVVYVVVSVISWRKAARDAEVMNSRLEEYQKGKKEEE